MVLEYVIIADDLSGACDTVVQFSNAGYKSIVLNQASNILTVDSQYTAVAITTNSRDVIPEEAKIKMEEVCSYLKAIANITVYKKIDSTWRGNIGMELEILIKSLDKKFALISSVYPQNKRIGLGGYLLVDGKLLHHTPMAQDPGSPTTEGYLPNLLRKQTKLPVEHISLQVIEQGINELEKYIINKLKTSGPCLFIADAVEESHLDTLALLSRGNLPSHILAGSAGLSSALLRQRSGSNPFHNSLPVLTIIGSVHPQSNLQVDEMVKKLGINEILITGEELLGLAETNLENLIQKAVEILYKEDLVLRTSRKDSDIQFIKDLGNRLGLNNLEIEHRISQVLQKTIASILEKVKIAGVMVTGGQTALQLLEGSEAKGIEVKEEIEPGIPVGKIIGGSLNGLKIITKAGGFGSTSVFCKGREYLKRREHR